MKKLTFFITILLIIIGVVVGVGSVVLHRAYVLPVLMYHRIDETAAITKLSVTPVSFARQMSFLKRHNYNVVPFSEIVRLLDHDKPIPPRTVAITFDDGYDDIYNEAFPVLRSYGFPAIFFIPPADVGKPGFVTWEQLIEMHEAGMDIGSHTLTGAFLPDPELTDKERRYELTESKRVLEKKISAPVDYIAYPLGGHNESIKYMTQQSGYLAACGTNPGPGSSWHDRYAIKRVRISRTSDRMLVFWIESSGYYTLIKEIRDD